MKMKEIHGKLFSFWHFPKVIDHIYYENVQNWVWVL